MKKLLKSRELALGILALVLIVIISVNNQRFLSAVNLMNVLKSNIILAIVSCGMLVVMITGGIDASVGAMISTTTLIVGNFLVHVSPNPVLAYVLGMLIGTLFGTVNGLLIAYLKLPPLVATLGMNSIASGLMIFLTKGAYINNIPQSFIDFGLTTFLKIFPKGDGTTIGLPIQVIPLVLVVALTYFLLRHTKMGRGVFAIGGNMLSAERVGVNVIAVQIFCYAFMGFICGVAGVTHISIMRRVDPNAFNGYEMDVIAAVILGGVNVLGGEGTLTGTLLGVALFAIINNGLTLLKISSYWQKIVLGAVMVIALCAIVIQKRHDSSRVKKVDIE